MYTKNISINLLIHNIVFDFNANKSGGMIFIIFKGWVYDTDWVLACIKSIT